MKLIEAMRNCKARGYIARLSQPEIKYWKNHDEPFTARIPIKDWEAKDWKCYDPEGEETSIIG